jgi:dTDP-4-amino-4,6-dideoxygalactose transaminase
LQSAYGIGSLSQESKFISWWEPAFGDEEVQAVADVVKGGFVNEGKLSDQFAEAIADFLGVKYALPTSSGTIAIYLALKAAGVSAGDEVIVPGLSFIATASAVVLAGARPVFVDILERDLNIDVSLIEGSITELTRAIMPVHINGRSADMDVINKIARQHQLAVVEDAAQALGSFNKNRALGTLSDAGCISLAPTKMITAAQGGLVLTNSDDIRDAVIRLKDHGRLSRSWNYHPEIGFNFKFNDVLAAIALAQLNRLPHRLERAKQHFQQYKNALSDIPQLKFIDTDFSAGTVPLWVDVIIDGDREAFIKHMREKNIDIRPFWPAMHNQDAYKSANTKELPVTEKMADKGLWLPSGAGKSEQDIQRVIDEVKQYFSV